MRLITALLTLLLATLALPAQTPDAPPLGSGTLPPLSLSDAQWMTMRAQQQLERREEAEGAEHTRLAILMLQSVMDYVTLVEQRRSTMTRLSFTGLGRQNINYHGKRMLHTFTPSEPLENVQALRFGISREMVRIHGYRLEGPDGEILERDDEYTLDPAIPGRTHIDLWDLRTVSSVTVTAEALTWDEGWPRLSVGLGQAKEPDHLRLALRYLIEARDALVQENPEQAIDRLDQAYRELGQAVEAESE